MSDDSDIKVESELVLSALVFARKAHEGQFRNGLAKTPYIQHPMSVMEVLMSYDIDDPETLAAALLHDVVEDCDVTEPELSIAFGMRVSSLVMEVTNPHGMSYDEVKEWQIVHAPRMSYSAKLLKIADRYCNTVDLWTGTSGWDAGRILAYVAHGERLVAAMGSVHDELEASFRRVCADTRAKLLSS